MTIKVGPVTLTKVTHHDGSKSYWLLWDGRYWHASLFEMSLIAKGATPAELGMNPYEELEQESDQ